MTDSQENSAGGWPPGALAEVGLYPTHAEAAEHGLVVLAMGLSYWVFQRPDGFHLLIEPGMAAAVRDELARYREESLRWPPRPAPVSEQDGPAAAATLAFAAVLGVSFLLDRAGGTGPAAVGMLDAHAVLRSGEWWRVITALTLHASVPHLLANVAAGSVFGFFSARRFGAGLGWLLILVCGALGNLATAWIHRGAGHLAVGASTAVFASLGLLAGAAAVAGLRAQRMQRQRRRRPILLPILAAIVLLGMLGAGGPNIDVIAHGAGFCCGLAAGLAIETTATPEGLRRSQRPAALAVPLLLTVAWAAAFFSGA